MHVQAPQMRDIPARAQAAGKVTVLGGPSVSASPEMYPELDYLHVGELGDGTDRLIARLDESVAPPSAQIRFKTEERLPLRDFPIPAYDLIPLKNYLMCTLQFSSGCPYRCEFCDIPGPLRPPAAAQDAAADHRRARRHAPADGASADGLFRRRQFHRQPQSGARDAAASGRVAEAARLSDAVRLRGDAQHRQADRNLELMREAQFVGMFVGIETPEADALKAMRKEQNVAVPMLESIKTLNDYGLEVTSGIILGLDTDSDDTESRLIDFIDLSQIPMLTINLLQALPKTPLWDRLKRDGTPGRDRGDAESNVVSCGPMTRWWRCGGAPSPMRTIPSGCSSASATRSRRPM